MRHIRVSLALLLAAGCAGGPLGGVFRTPTPWEQYEEHLRQAGLTETALGRAWLRAGALALAAPVIAELPLRETGYLPAESPRAVGYRMELTRGRTFELEVDFEAVEPTRLFVDLFELRDGEPRRIASLPEDTTVLRHEVRRTGSYLLRIQPELLRSGRYTVTQRTLATLPFPIPEANAGTIQSGFGAPRDAGRREHHGVDIFVPRGTPVVAVREGVAYPSTNDLGGTVVWLNDGQDRRTYYYAHLDRWAFESSRAVVRGDTLGFVGNSGNARTTAPHLHFGIYERGPADPFPFLAADDPDPGSVDVPLDWLTQWVRLSALRATLRSGPHPDAAAVDRLDRGVVARVEGAARRSLRVRLPDGTAGYLDRAAVVLAETGAPTEGFPAGQVLREAPLPGAPAVLILESATSGSVLGRYGAYELVRLPDAGLAWREIR